MDDDTLHNQSEFLHWAIDAYRRTERVLRFHGATQCPGPKVDFERCRRTLEDLCRAQGRDAQDMESLRAIEKLVEGRADRTLTSAAWIEGRKQLDRYNQWLQRTFPDATAPACTHPEVQLNPPCERCGVTMATVHVATISAQGIEKHDFCDTCHQESEGPTQTPG